MRGHSQHLPGYSTYTFPTVPFSFLPAVSKRTIPSQLLSCMPPDQRGKNHGVSTSLELKAPSSSPGGAPQTGRGISVGRKRSCSSPGQNRCFCSSEPSLVIPGCLKSIKVQLCNQCLREALQRPQINSLAAEASPGDGKHVEEMHSANAVGVSQLPKPNQCQSSPVWSARLHPWAADKGWMCSQVSHPTRWQMLVMCGTSPV